MVEVIIGVDFMLAHGINLNLGQQLMGLRNVEIPPNIAYKHPVHSRRIVAVEQQKLPSRSESLISAHMEGDCEETSLWVVEPVEMQTDLISTKTLVNSTEQKTDVGQGAF